MPAAHSTYCVDQSIPLREEGLFTHSGGVTMCSRDWDTLYQLPLPPAVVDGSGSVYRHSLLHMATLTTPCRTPLGYAIRVVVLLGVVE